MFPVTYWYCYETKSGDCLHYKEENNDDMHFVIWFCFSTAGEERDQRKQGQSHLKGY